MIRSFTKESLVNGNPIRMACLETGGQTYSRSRGLARVVQIEDEWYEDGEDPASVIAALRGSRAKADIITFWQRLPDIKPRFDFCVELEPIAALLIKTFDYWWNKQIRSNTTSARQSS